MADGLSRAMRAPVARLLLLALVLCVGAADAAQAAKKHRTRHHHPAWAGPYVDVAPAR